MEKLTESEIWILAWYCQNRYNAYGAYADVYGAIPKHRDKRKGFIYRSLIKELSKIWKSINKTFYHEINKSNNELLFDHLNRHLYTNVICYKKNTQDEVVWSLLPLTCYQLYQY